MKSAWTDLKELFQEAADLPADRRAAFLDRECPPHARAEVERLLASYDESSGFLDSATNLGASAGAAPSETLAPRARFGPYRIAALLGRGGMGDVYLARDVRVGQYVALKLLPDTLRHHPERLARFEREGRAAAALSHPHICAVHELGSVEGQPYIAMEYVQGEPLDVRVGRGPLPIASVIDIAAQIAAALTEAHAKRIVHRDLKCANVILTPTQQIKIIDFGIAKRLGAGNGSRPATVVTAYGMLIGTAAYMSPEQASGAAIDHRSDLFSFGVILYELITGRQPFRGRTYGGVIEQILRTAPPPLVRDDEVDVPGALAAIVTRLLEKQPAARFQSADDVAAAIAELRPHASVP